MFGAGQLISPKLIEIVGEHGGFDALWLDGEHAGITMKEIELATMAARAYGMDHFVRLPATDYATIMRPLEAGAGGVMVSMVRSPEEAEQAVRWAKFWPRGERGMNGGNRDGRFGLTPMAEYAAQANAETFVGIQIETPSALAAVAEIAAVPDVDLLFVGPADLSQMLGIPGDFENPRSCFPGRAHPEGRRGVRQGEGQTVGNCATRAPVRPADARLGLPDVRPRDRHSRRPRRHPKREGTPRVVLPGSLSSRQSRERGQAP